MSELKDNMLVEVVNNGTGSVSYYSELKRMKRRWDIPNAVKKVELEELRELVSTAGGYEILTDSLLIKDMKVREELGLPIDEEYLMDESQLKELLKKTVNTIEKKLEYAPDSVVEKATNIAIEAGLSDMDKLELLKDFSGIDVLTAVQEKKEEGKQKETEKPKSRAKRGRPRKRNS